MFKKKREKFDSIFKGDSLLNKQIYLPEHYLSLKNIVGKNITLSTCDLRERLLIVDERENNSGYNEQIELLKEIISQDSPFVFFADSKDSFEQAKNMIKNNEKISTPVYIYKEKISFTCQRMIAFHIILHYSDFNADKDCFTKLFAETKDFLYKHLDPIVEFSVDNMNNIIKRLSLEEDHEFSSVIINAINKIIPFLKQHHNGKNEDFENVFLQKNNSFLLYFQNERFHEFFYLIAWKFYFYSSGTNLIDNEDDCVSILNCNFKRRFFILPTLNEQNKYKMSDLFIFHSKFITDNSNGSSFFILYTKKEHLNNFNYNWIGNILTLEDGGNKFLQRRVKFDH